LSQNAYSSKIHSIDSLAAKLGAMRNGHRVVHCHGVFDLLHVGHIRHLRQAKALGDVLVVTLTPDRYVNKGPTRPAFKENLRAEALAALDCVDYVAINDRPMADETIRRLKPNIYVKGGEYRRAEDDRTGGIERETQAVRAVGGTVQFTDDLTFSSSSLINKHLSSLPEDTRRHLRRVHEIHGADRVLQFVDGAQKLKALVIGETIIDEYQYCQAIGKSSKEPMLAVRRLALERFAGGILAVANHLADFCQHVEVLSVVGQPNPYKSFIENHVDPRVSTTLIERPGSPTIVKRRYIDSYFFQKLFCVYEMDDTPLDGDPQTHFCSCLEQHAAEADVVIVVDFGHGVITPRAVKVLCDRSKFLAVNAQSNAGNLGYNTVSKYPRADLVCVTENEMRLESRDRAGELRDIIKSIARKLSCPRVIATRGAGGALCYSHEDGFASVPALADVTRDRMGAGDTFLAIAALAAAQQAPIDLVGLIGNAAAAQAVASVGHRQPLHYDALFKHLQCLLK